MTDGVAIALGTNAKDLSGQTFGYLTALRPVGRAKGREIIWLCQCRCGNKHRTVGSRMKSGMGLSCGCRHKEIVSTHRMTKTPAHKSWMAMRARCFNPRAKGYEHYGGRGITICARWDSFENFLADMRERPAGMTIERIDNNGNYEPTNCRWATRAEQSLNTSQNHYLTYQGETLLISEWAKRLGVKTYVLCHRVAQGWPDERVVGQPFNRRFHATSPAPWQGSLSASKTPDTPPASPCSIR